MGYWFPPSPKAFDPVPRPLSCELRNGLYVPLELDTPLVAELAKTPLGQSIGAGRAYDLLIRMKPPPDSGISYTKEEQIGGWGSKSVPMTRWTAGDLPDGGLPPDTMNPDGSWTRHYWDLSDGQKPRRKCATRGTTGSQQWERVMQWNDTSGRWEEEGGDAEREAVEHFVEIMTIVMVVIRMVASATGVGAPAAALLGVALDAWKLALSQVQIYGWEPPKTPLTADAVLGELGGDFIGLAAAIGRTDAFGKLANEAQKTFSTLATTVGAYMPTQEIAQIGGSFKSSVDLTTQFIGGISNIGGREEGAIKVDPEDVFRYVKAMIDGGGAAQITPVSIRSKLPDEPEADPTTLDATIDYRRVMWDAACLAFYSPADVLLLRRNALMAWRRRSTIVSPSEQSAAARGLEESEETAIECGFAFDSYLAQMFSSQRSRERIAFAPMALRAGEATVQRPIQAKPTERARTDLDRATATLLKRYGVSHA